MFYARVNFDDAIVNIGMSSSDKASTRTVSTRPPRSASRAQLAESVKVLGPRRCIAACGPGTITPACPWVRPRARHIAPASAAAPKAGGTVFRDCPDQCPALVVVPAGSFTMGLE